MTTRIRRARRADAQAIGRIYVETWQSAYPGLLPDRMLASMSDIRQAAWWARALSDPAEARGIFVADDEAMGVVGFGSCGPLRSVPETLRSKLGSRRTGEVYTLYVEPDFQNRGYGRALLDALFKQLKSEGCTTVVLWMLADNPARFFYEALGGREVARRADHLGNQGVGEVAYAWTEIGTPLVSRRLASEE